MRQKCLILTCTCNHQFLSYGGVKGSKPPPWASFRQVVSVHGRSWWWNSQSFSRDGSILSHISRCIENEQNAPENRKLKVARKCRGKVRTRSERPSGLPTKLPDPNRAISGRHRRCRSRRSWAHWLHFGRNLEMHRDSAKMRPKTEN